MPLSRKASSNPGPATPAAMPVSTKMPAPIIAPTPIIVMSSSRISRLRRTSDEAEAHSGCLSFDRSPGPDKNMAGLPPPDKCDSSASGLTC